MTTIEFLERQIRRATLALHRSERKSNAPEEELQGLHEKLGHLREALEAVRMTGEWTRQTGECWHPIAQCAGCRHWYKGHCTHGPAAVEKTDPDFYCACFEKKGER